MCIAIVNKYGLFPADEFRTIFANNPDGIGFAFTDGHSVRIFKSLKDADALYDQYRGFRDKYPESPFLIHARIKTHGAADLKNAHPYHVNSDIALIHNGIIDAPIINPKKSDTWHLCRLIESMANPDHLFTDGSIESEWIDHLIGGSKIALIHRDGRYAIYGESLGHWIGDNWYSNYTYKSIGYRDIGGRKSYKWPDDDGSDDGYGWPDWIKWNRKTVKSESIESISDDDRDNAILRYFGYDPIRMDYLTRLDAIREMEEDYGMTADQLYKETLMSP